MDFVYWPIATKIQSALGITPELMVLLLCILVYGLFAALISLLRGDGSNKRAGRGRKQQPGICDDVDLPIDWSKGEAHTTDFSKGQIRTGESMGKPFSPFDR